jgi:hypothetical protein
MIQKFQIGDRLQVGTRVGRVLEIRARTTYNHLNNKRIDESAALRYRIEGDTQLHQEHEFTLVIGHSFVPADKKTVEGKEVYICLECGKRTAQPLEEDCIRTRFSAKLIKDFQDKKRSFADFDFHKR